MTLTGGLFKTSFAASLLICSMGASAAQPVRPGDSTPTVRQAAAQPAQPRPPRAKPNRGGVSPEVLAAIALGLGGPAIAAAASGGKSNASPD